MTAIATERVDLRFGEVDISMLRVAELAPHVDSERLLGAAIAEEPPYWMHLWPGAVAIARRLAAGPSLRGLRVLELGCGMALPALVAARLGAYVVATDWHRAPLAMAAASAAINGMSIAIVQMDWRASPLRGRFDLVLGADVAYDAAAEDALATAIAGHLRPGGRFLFGDSVNTYRLGFVEKLRAAGLSIVEAKDAEREDGRVVWVRRLQGEKRSESGITAARPG